MFLLPAIGAWISDGLILYIYFSGRGDNGHVTNSADGGGSLSDNVSCGDGTIPCRRIQHIDSQPSPFHDAVFKRNTLSSFPNSPDDVDTAEVQDQEDNTVFSSESFAPEVDESSLAPADESTRIYNENSEPIDDKIHKSDKVGISVETVERKTRYLSVLAIVRLILLTFPLSYAAYSGTRVPCVVVQYLFHGMSSMVVTSHMLAVLILDVPPLGDESDPADEGPVLFGAAMGSSSSGDTCWTLLSLSLVSIMLHFLIVLHVRSTGPDEDGLYEEKRKRKRLAYAMASQSNGAASRGGKGVRNGLQINSQHHDDEEELADETLSPLLLPEGDCGSNEDKLTLKERFMCLPDQYEAFVSDTQARFDAAQRMWAERLEIMTKSLQQNNTNDSADGDGHSPSRGEGALQSPHRNLESSNLLTHAQHAINTATKLVPIKPDPFRVLLQLFAYEDVLSGPVNKLDLAFAVGSSDGAKKSAGNLTSDGGSAALSFYAPQLLSFLLHGAFFSISSKLEEWILKKCGEDLHFAHRCFWFLRSWCLGSSSESPKPIHAQHVSSGSIGEFGGLEAISLEPDLISRRGSALNRLRGVESNLYLSSSQGLLPAPPPLYRSDESSSSGLGPPENIRWDNSTRADKLGESSSRFSPDETVLIEQLLQRVVERGMRPATVAQYGSIDGRITDDYNSSDSSNGYSRSPSALATAVEQGLVPIDPQTGVNSTAHLDCITSAHKHGFLPLSDSGQPYQKPTPNDAASLFFAAPIFLDAMLSIADDLMNVNRSNRTAALKQRLRSLEVELLPSNVVYLPIQNMQHRVWRIVSDESLALSTNERVPCIITLEVIDCEVSDSSSRQHLNNSESSVTSAWVSTPRPPHRHSTLIDKMATYTQEGLKRLEESIDRSLHHGDTKGNLDRRLSDFLGMRDNALKKSTPSYTAVNSHDELQNGHDEEIPEERELGDLKTPSKGRPRDSVGDDVLLELCPPPPLGGPLLPDNGDEAPKTPKTPTQISEPNNHIQESPMGQWSTPKKKSLLSLRKRKMVSIEDIQEDSDEELSPQGKQRNRVVFPPASVARSESMGDEPQNDDPLDQDDTDAAVLTSAAPAVVFKEDWHTKTDRLRKCSIYGSHPGWRLLPILIKSNDDLRQEQLASQLIQRMANILAKGRVPVWLFPYEIVALTGRGGIIECVPDTISLDSLKRNDPNFTSLKSFFEQHFGRPGSDGLANAKANFVESLAAYSIVCFLMQIKDRHNGNILLTNKGHIVHIDFGFYFLSSPGKNSGFESAPFKLTRDFVNLMDGPDSRTFQKYRELCYKTFIELRRHCYQIILLVEMLMEGNEDLQCFRGRPEEAVRQLKERFRLDLNDNGVRKYVDSLIDESLENWRTRWYDRYQRFCVGVL